MASLRSFNPLYTGSHSASSEKVDLVVEPVQGSRNRLVKTKMLTMRNFVLAALLCVSVGVGLSNATFLRAEDGIAIDLSRNSLDQDLTTFSRLLNAASPKALRQFLHELVPATTKPGVLYSERSAVVALRAESPDLASSIVHLAMRQDPGNTTTITTTTATTSTTDTPTSTSTTPTPTSTSSSTSTVSATSTPSSVSSMESTTTSMSTSLQPPSTTSEQTTSTPTSTSAPPTSTSSSSTLAFTSPSTSMVISPSTASTMSTLSTTLITSSTTSNSTPMPTSATSTFTSTLPGGAVTTITQVAIVTPETTDMPTSTSSGMGNLQTGSPATRPKRPALELWFGLVVGSVLLI
ncbi:hypothetical protein F5Y18DRAFT_302133 [Xylariaceae sp. FL1019]|nr:hypothetical protein F5Y18DRAFT_302133 [Xylariaceae sp. FL1019]